MNSSRISWYSSIPRFSLPPTFRYLPPPSPWLPCRPGNSEKKLMIFNNIKAQKVSPTFGGGKKKQFLCSRHSLAEYCSSSSPSDSGSPRIVFLAAGTSLVANTKTGWGIWINNKDDHQHAALLFLAIYGKQTYFEM